jgi:hypothetical protein
MRCRCWLSDLLVLLVHDGYLANRGESLQTTVTCKVPIVRLCPLALGFHYTLFILQKQPPSCFFSAHS